jgi:hypothetical protein
MAFTFKDGIAKCYRDGALEVLIDDATTIRADVSGLT